MSIQDLDRTPSSEQLVNTIDLSKRFNITPVSPDADAKQYARDNHLNLIVTYRWLLSPTAAIPDGRWQPYVAAGFGPAFPHLELKLTKDSPEWSEYAYHSGFRNFNFSVGIGMRGKFSPHLGAYLEYKFSYSHLHGMHFYGGAGNLAMAFGTHHLMWGISLIF